MSPSKKQIKKLATSTSPKQTTNKINSSSSRNNNSSSTKKKKDETPSIFNALIIYGILPVLLFIAFSLIDERTFGLLDGLRIQTIGNGNGNGVDVDETNRKRATSANHAMPSTPEDEKIQRLKKIYNSDYSNYKSQLKAYQRQSQKVGPQQKTQTQTQSSQSQSNRKPSNPNNPKQKIQTQGTTDTDELRKQHKSDPNNMYKAYHLAEALLQQTLTTHDGGQVIPEAIQVFLKAISLIGTKRVELLNQGVDVRLCQDGRAMAIDEQLMLSMEVRSVEALLIGAYTSLGRQYFMADMFEKTVEANDSALKLEPNCVDALNGRAGALIILGKFDEAGADFSKLLDIDAAKGTSTVEMYSGIVKVLKAKEDAIPNGGWKRLVDVVTRTIQLYEQNLSTIGDANVKRAIMGRLKLLHLVLHAYHEFKTGDSELAWHHLTTGSKYKMANLPPYDHSRGTQQTAGIKSIFKRGFWTPGIGSKSKQPIFIVGFPRSGSTLLERILDAHPAIVGTGENSVFNGLLNEIRNSIVQVISTGGTIEALQSVVQANANKVDSTTRRRWREIQRNSEQEKSIRNSATEPKYFVDKMLSNTSNIGFIHLLYPNALILHIAREPMDTIYSAFKHDFPTGSFDYTSDFESLAHMFSNYRDIMDHWDRELPGRVTHIRYEDIVHDKEGMAKAIIAAAGLEWEDDVLNFHKKKQAVNTHSTTQVRKGVYKDSLQTWKKYEDQLQPLIEFLGASNIEHKFKTTLQGYQPAKR